jgi:hypothetical protein
VRFLKERGKAPALRSGLPHAPIGGNSVARNVATARTVVLRLSAALAGCATGRSPKWLNARAGRGQQWEATSNPPPTTVSDAYIDQCMTARGKKLDRALDPATGGASAPG